MRFGRLAFVAGLGLFLWLLHGIGLAVVGRDLARMARKLLPKATETETPVTALERLLAYRVAFYHVWACFLEEWLEIGWALREAVEPRCRQAELELRAYRDACLCKAAPLVVATTDPGTAGCSQAAAPAGTVNPAGTGPAL